MKNIKLGRKSYLIISMVVVIIGFKMYYNHHADNFVESIEVGVDGGATPVNFVNYQVSTMPQDVVRYVTDCHRIPDNIFDLSNKIINENGRRTCQKTEITPESKFRFINPWGNPYQIRYDLERGKLQIRSQGRYLWWPWDDIVGETFFNGNSYKAQVEYCKTVPRNDMSCIFNRGWH